MGIGKKLIEPAVAKAKAQGVKELMTITSKKMKTKFVADYGFGEQPHGFKVALFKQLGAE